MTVSSPATIAAIEKIQKKTLSQPDKIMIFGLWSSSSSGRCASFSSFDRANKDQSPKIKDQELSCFVFYCLPTLFQHLAVPDKAGARIGGELEILRQLQTISWTRFLAERAEHAS